MELRSRKQASGVGPRRAYRRRLAQRHTEIAICLRRAGRRRRRCGLLGRSRASASNYRDVANAVAGRPAGWRRMRRPQRRAFLRVAAVVSRIDVAAPRLTGSRRPGGRFAARSVAQAPAPSRRWVRLFSSEVERPCLRAIRGIEDWRVTPFGPHGRRCTQARLGGAWRGRRLPGSTLLATIGATSNYPKLPWFRGVCRPQPRRPKVP